MSSINLATNEWSLTMKTFLSRPSLPTQQTDELISNEGIKNLHSSGMFRQKSVRGDLISPNEITLVRNFVRSHVQHRLVNLCISTRINYKIR